MIATLRNALGATTMSEDVMSSTQSLQIMWKSCDTLPIRIFYEILKTGNLNLLGNGSQKQLSDLWADLLDEYWQLSDSVKYKSNLRKTKSLLLKRNKFTTLLAIVKKHELGGDVKEDLEYWNLKNVLDAIQAIRVLKTNIAFDIARNRNDEDKKTAYNFYKDLAVLEQVLKRSIDSEKITVSYWIELRKLADQLNNNERKQAKKKRK